MNSIISKLNKLSSKLKITVITLVCCVFIGLISFIGISLSSTSSSYLETKTVDGLVFDKGTIVYDNNSTKYTVEVTNTNNNDYALDTISVIIRYDDNQEEIIGYIGNTIKANETRLLDVSIDKKLDKILNIDYKINK